MRISDWSSDVCSSDLYLVLVPLLMGFAFMASSTPPDLLVPADGRHLAVQVPGGGLAILRARAGDYVRDTLSESADFEGELVNIEDLPNARCSADLCAINIVADDRNWRVLATR